VAEPSAPLVLLVEDDQSGREMYAMALEMGNFRVAQAHNGLQALEKARELLPDVIVTDLALPGIDGLELCRRLRQDERTSRIPIIGLTGSTWFVKEPDRATRAGCDRVLIKPCPPSDLQAEIIRVLAAKTAEQS
jgi:two-component system cell cycle response regulator DivK